MCISIGRDRPITHHIWAMNDGSYRWRVLLLGQVAAVAAALNNTTTYVLVIQLGVKLPLVELWLVYLMLSLHLLLGMDENATLHQDEAIPNSLPLCEKQYGKKRSCHVEEDNFGASSRKKGPLFSLLAPWWAYGIIAFLDVLANAMALWAMKYTSIPSATLLESLTTPSAMLAAMILLNRKYVGQHYSGVILSIGGGCLAILADNHHIYTTNNKQHESSSSLHGDMLAVLAAILYGLNDTLSEYCVKKLDRTEYLGMLGLWGMLWTALLLLVVEKVDGGGSELQTFLDLLLFRHSSSIYHTLKVLGVMGLYVGGVVLYYRIATRFLMNGDVALLELSIQASNLWAILLSVVVVSNSTDQSLQSMMLFGVALILITAGVIVYEVKGESQLRQIDGYYVNDDGPNPRPGVPHGQGQREVSHACDVEHNIRCYGSCGVGNDVT